MSMTLLILLNTVIWFKTGSNISALFKM